MAGVGHLDIGIGEGSAQVFGSNPAIATYANILQQRKLKQDQDNKYIAETLAQAKPEGLRNDADRQTFYKQYSDLKNKAIAAENEKDKFKKAMALADVKQGVMDLNSYVDQSKKQAAKENMMGNAIMQAPHNWTDDAVQRYRKSLEAPIGHSDVITDPTTLERRVDPDKVDKQYQEHKDLLTKNLQYDNGTYKKGVEPGTGRKGAWMVQTRGIPMDGQGGALESTLHWVSANPDVQKSLQDRYPQIQGQTPQETMALRTKQYMVDRGDNEGIYDQTKPVFKYAQEPVRPSWMENWFMSHYGVPYNPNTASQQNMTPIYRQKWVDTMLAGTDPDAGGILKAKVAADPTYDGKLLIGEGTGKAVKGQIAFTIPPKRKWDSNSSEWTQTAPERTVFIDKKDPNARIKLNELVNELSGEKVDISSLQTPGGKKHIGTSQQQSKPTTSKLPKQVHSAQDFDAIQPGEYFMAPNGKLYQKK